MSTPLDHASRPEPKFTPEMEDLHDAALRRHNHEKPLALKAHSEQFSEAVTQHVMAAVRQVPFVARGLFDNDEPEGRKLPDALDRLEGAYAAFSQRVGMLHHLAGAMNTEGDIGEPYDAKYWDQVRLQRAATLDRAVQLAAEVCALAFACEQYAAARYIWRGNGEVADG